MNTVIIKKESISKCLGELFQNTCIYSPVDTGAYNCIIEPDIKALKELRFMLSGLAEKHFLNMLTIQDVLTVQDYVKQVGYKHGHYTYSYLTGTWGVRYTELDNIINILNIPEFELPRVKSDYKIYDLDCTIYSYSITGNYLWIELEPKNHEINRFKIDFNWRDLNPELRIK